MGGAKKQETNLKRKMKRRINKLKVKAGFPAQRKKTDTALLDIPISVMFVDNTKGGLLAKNSRKRRRGLGGRQAIMSGWQKLKEWHCQDSSPVPTHGVLETVAARTALCVSRRMKRVKIANNAIYCTRAAAGYARWVDRRQT